MDKLAYAILNKYVDLADNFLSARFANYSINDIEKVASYLIEADQASIEKTGVFGQTWKAKKALRSAQRAHEAAKLNDKTQKLLAKANKIEKGKPGSIGKLISGALAASAGAIGGGMLVHQYDERIDREQRKQIAANFFVEGLKRGRVPQMGI